MSKRAVHITASPRLWLPVLLVAFALSLCLSATEPAENDALRLLTSAAPNVKLIDFTATSGTGQRRLTENSDTLAVEYTFPGAGRDRLTIRVSLPSAELDSYRLRYGYLQSELDALQAGREKALKEAYRQAVTTFLDQAGFDAIAAEINAEHDRRFKSFLEERGFRFVSDRVVTPDIPKIVKQNVAELRPLALELDRLAEKHGYTAANIIRSALTLVQTALEYRTIPDTLGERHTGGITPPLVTLVEGGADCDSKTALLAATLLNWNQVRLIGLGVPDHYLMGVMQNPGKGDLYVEYADRTFVLIEPAGPAWLPPGQVSDYTLQILNGGGDLIVEPLSI